MLQIACLDVRSIAYQLTVALIEDSYNSGQKPSTVWERKFSLSTSALMSLLMIYIITQQFSYKHRRGAT